MSFEWTENGPRNGLFLEANYRQLRQQTLRGRSPYGPELKDPMSICSPIIRRNRQMKLASVVLASALAFSCNLAQGQSASSTAGGSSKAGGPSAISGTTGASKGGSTTGAVSSRHRHHRKHSELSGILLAQAGGAE
jgi:hypothetical protein